MDRLKNIPVIGYLIRLVASICKLPQHVDEIYSLKQELQETKAMLEESRSWNSDRIREIEELRQWNSDRMMEIEELRRWNADRMSEIQALDELQLDKTYFERLGLLLSLHPVVWGDKSRLHISSLATVNSCFFNTNSGKIFIGDYTFAGSGVSILAGSHDPQLTGLPRREAELKDGCDIHIGKGVWLASNCTILGPATIEDNAVIAAGAVVIPGTHVERNTIYGGVPAKCIRELKLEEGLLTNNPAVQKALERNGGVLFVSGWTEKKERVLENTTYLGYEMTEEKALIYTNKDTCDFLCMSDQENSVFNVWIDRHKKIEMSPIETNGIVNLDLNIIGDAKISVHVIVIEKGNANADLFVNWKKKND